VMWKNPVSEPAADEQSNHSSTEKRKWARLDSNQQPSGYASHCSFRCPFRVCGLDYLFIPRWGRLPFSLYTFLAFEAWLGITLSADLGFPEFGRCAPEDYSPGRPLQIVISRYHTLISI